MQYITPENQTQNKLNVHRSQRPLHVCPINQPLYVISVVFNPNRYANRYKLYHAFEKHCEDSGAILYTVELALRDRHHEVTCSTNPRHIQLRTESEIWFKENIQNVGLRYLPHDFEYVAFIDADFQFNRSDWAYETVQMLQHRDVVQMYSSITYLNDRYRVHNQLDGLVYLHQNQLQYPKTYGHRGAVGGAWAYRRSAVDKLGGMLDTCILGSADWHMSFALLMRDDVHPEMKFNQIPEYARSIKEWAERAKLLRANVGYVDCNATHFWHGHLKDRKYNTRWEILVNNNFDPYKDLKRDWQGVLSLEKTKPRLRDEIMEYFKQRNEDSLSEN